MRLVNHTTWPASLLPSCPSRSIQVLPPAAQGTIPPKSRKEKISKRHMIQRPHRARCPGTPWCARTAPSMEYTRAESPYTLCLNHFFSVQSMPTQKRTAPGDASRSPGDVSPTPHRRVKYGKRRTAQTFPDSPPSDATFCNPAHCGTLEPLHRRDAQSDSVAMHSIFDQRCVQPETPNKGG